MKQIILTTIAALSCLACSAEPQVHDYPIVPVDFTQVEVTDEFWAPKIKTNTEVTIPIAIYQCESTGRIDNFKAAGGLITPGHRSQMRFDDSDVYKVIEGIAYSLMVTPNPELEAKADSIISYIAAAQEEDGYLYTPLTNKTTHVKKTPTERWVTTHSESHELYCLGHFYEAAAAYYKATGKREVLDVAIKSANLVCDTFNWDNFVSYPGHPEIEVGLAKLFRVTGDERYIQQSKFFLDARSNKPNDRYESYYRQSHMPVLEQKEPVGHAVRALYLYSGMVDVAAMTGDEEYVAAVKNIWSEIANKHLYVTGGVGSGNGNGEGFGKPYELYNVGAYNETCAAIANVYFNHRLFLMEGDAKYADIMERALYNNVLSGVNVEGNMFAYPNTLETTTGASRREWFGCACCPSNICRFLSSFAGYIYAQQQDNLYVNLYVANNANIDLDGVELKINQRGNILRDGVSTMEINPDKSSKFAIHLRIPGWASETPSRGSSLYSFAEPLKGAIEVTVNGKAVKCKEESGYLVVNRKWSAGDELRIELPLEIRAIEANELVKVDAGKIALQRGPIVYCSEGVDSPKANITNMVLESTDGITAVEGEGIFADQFILKGEAKSVSRAEGASDKMLFNDIAFTATPYYTRANRGMTAMRVWYPTSAQYAIPAPASSIATRSGVKLQTAGTDRVYDVNNLVAINMIRDQITPTESNDKSVEKYLFTTKPTVKNPTHMLEYTFAKVEPISQTMFFWSNEINATKVPQQIELSYKAGNEWHKIDIDQSYLEADQVNVFNFAEVKASAIKVVITPDKGSNVGIFEWSVQ